MVNIEEVLLVALQSISGCLAGYITNKYAVNMLFKEYTIFNKFKFGGVIKNRKIQFIEEISDLVERDIINPSTLKKKLKSNKVKKEIEIVLNTFLNNELIKNFEKTEIRNIPGFEKSLQAVKKLSYENYDEIFKPLISEICNEIDLESLLSEEQVSCIAENIYNLILQSIDNNNSINKVITDLYGESSNFSLSSFIDVEVVSKVENNIQSIISSAIDKKNSNDDKLISLLEKIIKKSKAQDIINNFQDSIKNKKLEEIVTDKEIEELSSNLTVALKNYLNSKQGKDFLSNIIKEFIALLKNMEFTLYDLLDDKVVDKLNLTIREKLPVFLKYVVSWIEKNKDEFDELIEKSVDEGIQDMDFGIRKAIITLVREHFLDNVSAKYEVVQKVKEFIESYNMDSNDSINLAEKIIDYLKNTNINEIITSLEKNNILNDKIINNLCTIIITYLSDNNDLILSIIKKQKGRLVSDFIKYDFNNFLDVKSKVNVYNLVLKHKEKIKEFIVSTSYSKMKSEINAIYKKNLKAIISEDFIENIKGRSKNSIKQVVINNEEKIKVYLSGLIKGFINDFKFKNIAESSDVKNKILNLQDELLERTRTIQVSSVIKNFAVNKENIHCLNEISLKCLEDKLEDFLHGRIKKMVYDNLIQYEEDEICDMAQRFMGTELKPLSIFGGMLGFVGGLIFALCFRNIGFEGYYYSLIGVIGSVILMGGIGVATNVIAIAMLFKPYKKNKVLSKIPFFRKFALGYIPSHKESLANGIGNVIDNDILNAGRIHKLFNNKRNDMYLEAMNFISSDNYKIINSNVVKNKNLICNYFYNKILSFLNKGNANSMISNIICENEISVSTNILSKISLSIKQNSNSIKKYLVKFIEGKMNSNNTVIEFLPKELMEVVEDKVELLINEKTKELINQENVKMLFIKYNDIYKSYIDREISDIISEDMISSLEKNISSKMEEFLYNDLKFVLNCKIREMLTIELDQEQTIGNVFDGIVQKAVDKNFNKLTQFIVNKINSVITENEDNIGYLIKDNISSKLNFFQKIGYAMANGDAVVDRCTHILINKNLPLFIDEKVNEVQDMISDVLTNQIYTIKLIDISFGVNEVNFEQFIDGAFTNLQKGKKLNNITKVITKEVIDRVKDLNIYNVLSNINLDSTEKIFNKFKNEINYFTNLLLQNINLINEVVLINLKNLINEVTVKDLCRGLSDKNLETLSDNIVKIFIKSSAIDKGSLNILKEVYEKSLKGKKISAIVNRDLLNSDIENIINKILENKNIKACTNNMVENIFDEICKDNLAVISTEFKDDINSRVSQATIDSLIVHTKDILESFELKSITCDEIEKMKSEEIHNLFKAFAGEYFKKLYIYGVMGAVFGVDFWLSMLIAVLDYVKEKRDNTVKEN